MRKTFLPKTMPILWRKIKRTGEMLKVATTYARKTHTGYILEPKINFWVFFSILVLKKLSYVDKLINSAKKNIVCSKKQFRI